MVGTPENPLDVAVGIYIDQITFVDQKSENFGAVLTIRAIWSDPGLAYDPADYGRDVRLFRRDEFVEHASKLDVIVPGFVVNNQQANRWIQQSIIAVNPDGHAEYFERSSATLQAPHFNFRKYPFDQQKFYVDIVSIYPSSYVRYSILPDSSGLGKTLGEEEWLLDNAEMSLSKITGISGRQSDMVTLGFEGNRHILYYVIRIFLPMLVLIVVSWSLFFLDEYRKRIEIAGANLLVFVGFNWIISDDLPKLGYLTFLDFILQCMFVVTGAVIVFNVLLRKLSVSGRLALAQKLDIYMIRWIYPLGYAAVVAYAVANFLLV